MCWCDREAIAMIVDERAGGPRECQRREVGEKIVVPNSKITWDGHGVIFIGIGSQLYCYIAPGRRLSQAQFVTRR